MLGLQGGSLTVATDLPVLPTRGKYEFAALGPGVDLSSSRSLSASCSRPCEQQWAVPGRGESRLL